jgi:Mn2+/Fe2+ NRAMP family transporter
MLLSNVVMYFIILSAAATLHQSTNHEIESATQAAEALKPIAGQAAFLLMALGLIGTGVLAVPILTASAAYSIAEVMGWECGLDKKPRQAKEFYLVMAGSTLGALLINYLGVNPMKALFITAVINGFLAPPLLVGLMIVSNNRKIMGDHVNGLVLNVLGWSTTALMFIAAIVLVWTWTQ